MNIVAYKSSDWLVYLYIKWHSLFACKVQCISSMSMSLHYEKVQKKMRKRGGGKHTVVFALNANFLNRAPVLLGSCIVSQAWSTRKILQLIKSS